MIHGSRVFGRRAHGDGTEVGPNSVVRKDRNARVPLAMSSRAAERRAGSRMGQRSRVAELRADPLRRSSPPLPSPNPYSEAIRLPLGPSIMGVSGPPLFARSPRVFMFRSHALAVAAIGLSLVGSSHLSADPVPFSYYVSSDASHDPAVPEPRNVLGFEVGEWHVRPDQIVAYFRELAAQSDRVSVETYGRTYEHRPLLLIAITSPANQARLEEIRPPRGTFSALSPRSPMSARRSTPIRSIRRR